MKINLAFKNDDKTIPVGFESNDNGFGVYVGDVQPVSGPPGKSAYEVALENGFEGTEEEWLNSLKGDPGRTPEKGKDYYTEADVQSIIGEAVEILRSTTKAAKIGTITLLADAWIGENNLYSQVVSVEGVTEFSQVDITPSIEQLAVFYEKDISFVTENEDGVVTVYVIGQKPTSDYTLQVTITEVSV